MDTTFISIHDLSPAARILYSSDSVVDILGFTPDEIVNTSAWNYFDPQDLPVAQRFHAKRIASDKVAVLAYCRVRSKDGDWKGCEVCFSVVYDVLIVCTSKYMRGPTSIKRAHDAPMIRRIFNSSPKDPRYHMLSHLSTKFTIPSKIDDHEPRAALFLNRFTRTLSIMYATTGLQDVIGIPASAMRGLSFYCCIAENCLADAVKCLEGAKGNDSIAYLRFWFRDPRNMEQLSTGEDSDEEMTEASIDTDAAGGIDIQTNSGASVDSEASMIGFPTTDMEEDDTRSKGRGSSGDSADNRESREAIFGEAHAAQSSASSLGLSPDQDNAAPIELEAVISCTSDGLVVCLRRARPLSPSTTTQRSSRTPHDCGIFAAPWAADAILPQDSAFAPSLKPQSAPRPAEQNVPTPVKTHDFMQAIKEQAVFAWALTGINGYLAEFGRGTPMAESYPQDGLPIWASDPKGEHINPANPRQNGYTHPGPNPDMRIFGDPGLVRSNGGARGFGGFNGS